MRSRIVADLSLAVLVRVALFVLLTGLAGNAVAASAADSPPLPQVVAEDGWQSLGSGDLRWLGFKVYRASLWSPDVSDWQESGRFALVIRYERSIPSARLVQASLDEMRRLDMADEAQLQRWAPILQRAFPDVAAGDRITGVNRPGEGVAFYFGDELTEVVPDPAFAQAFFAIWLDERTREPRLRASLMGEGADG